MKYVSTPSMLTVVSDDGLIRVAVSRADISYPALHDYVVTQGGQDIHRISEIAVESKAAIEEVISAVEQAVDDVAYSVQHGDPVADVVFDHAQRISTEGTSPKVLGRFAARLAKNPSGPSRSQLFAWMAAEGFTLTRKGLIVGYKAVTEDFRSLHHGAEPVTITQQDGTSEVITGQVPYPVGATVEMDRDVVNADRDYGCSVGLHVGTYAYAQGFVGGRGHIMLVLVDPADVVSVPKDSNNQKMRVSKLTVAAIAEDGKVPDAVLTERDDDLLAAYLADPENEIVVPDDDEDDEGSEAGTDWWDGPDEDDDEDDDDDGYPWRD